MAKVDMDYVNYKLFGKRSQKSNKNRTSDILREIADAIGFDMAYLREEKSNMKGYAIEEDDISVIKEMVDLAHTFEGKRLRCKDFREEYCEVLEQWITSFKRLARHNGVTEKELFNIELTMLWQTKGILIKKAIFEKNERLRHDVNDLMFAPTDYLLNQGFDEDDQLVRADKLNFLAYLKKYATDDIQDLRGRYWCFVAQREAKQQKEFIDGLHEMSKDEIKAMVNATFRYVKFQQSLDENDKYSEVLEQWARVESGEGKLQDKSKIKLYAKEMVGLMDECAKDFLDESDYIKGELKMDRGYGGMEAIDWQSELEESKEVFYEAQRFYNGLKMKRKEEKLTPETEMLIEMGFRKRFGVTMF